MPSFISFLCLLLTAGAFAGPLHRSPSAVLDEAETTAEIKRLSRSGDGTDWIKAANLLSQRGFEIKDRTRYGELLTALVKRHDQKLNRVLAKGVFAGDTAIEFRAQLSDVIRHSDTDSLEVLIQNTFAHPRVVALQPELTNLIRYVGTEVVDSKSVLGLEFPDLDRQTLYQELLEKIYTPENVVELADSLRELSHVVHPDYKSHSLFIDKVLTSPLALEYETWLMKSIDRMSEDHLTFRGMPHRLFTKEGTAGTDAVMVHWIRHAAAFEKKSERKFALGLMEQYALALPGSSRFPDGISEFITTSPAKTLKAAWKKFCGPHCEEYEPFFSALDLPGLEDRRAYLARNGVQFPSPRLASTPLRRPPKMPAELSRAAQKPGPTVKTKSASSPYGIDFDLSLAEDRARLENIAPALGRRVFGQDEAVEKVATAVRARATRNTGKPIMMAFLGSSGIGKTELAKTVADVVYGDPTAVMQFDMGKIQDATKLSDIVGSATGYIGSEKIAPFEKFIVEHPNGGVFLYDEVGNMGASAADPRAMKEAIFQALGMYTIAGEGKWMNREGKVFELDRFIFMMTSNEGQELFGNEVHDDLRLATWRAYRSPQTLAELMKESGWPIALIGRMQGNIVLFKPLDQDARVKVTRKFFDLAMEPTLGKHGVDKVTYAPEFLNSVAELFFSHRTGARGIAEIADQEVASLFTETIMGMYREMGDSTASAKAELVLHLETSNAVGTRVALGSPELKHVNFRIEVRLPGRKSLSFHAELYGKLEKRRKLTRKESVRISIHEAGHAVANVEALTGYVVDHITNHSGNGKGGYVRFVPVDGAARTTTSRENVVAQIARTLAGGIAEQLEFGEDVPSSGRSGDLATARIYAEDAIIEQGLSVDALKFATTGNGKVLATDPLVQKEILRLLADGEAFARARLQDRWPAVRAVAAALIARSRIEADEFSAIVEKAATAPARPKKRPHHHPKPADCRFSNRPGPLPGIEE